MRNKAIKVITIVYLVLMLLGTRFYYTIPKTDLVKGMSGTEIKEPVDLKFQYEFLENPKLLTDKAIQEKHKVRCYTFDYKGEELGFIFEEQEHIVLERKETEDSKIEVYWYPGVQYVNGVDLSHLIKEPEVNLVDKKLSTVFEKQRFNYTKFSKDVVINQFLKDNNKEQDRGIMGSLNSGIIYIKVPKNLKITGEEQYKFIKE